MQFYIFQAIESTYKFFGFFDEFCVPIKTSFKEYNIGDCFCLFLPDKKVLVVDIREREARWDLNKVIIKRS